MNRKNIEKMEAFRLHSEYSAWIVSLVERENVVIDPMTWALAQFNVTIAFLHWYQKHLKALGYEKGEVVL